MATLFEIDREIAACIKPENSDDFVNTETGEIIDVNALEDLKMERDKKLRNIGCLLLNLEADEKMLAEQEKKFKARKEAVKKNRERLKNYVAMFLGGEPWKCTECQFTWRSSESVAFNGKIEDVPPEYLRVNEPELDKEKIKKALKSGIEIAGCSLEKKSSVNVK